MVIMYHYTNKQGLDAIKKHGYISESNNTARDTTFGFGVYLTHLSQDIDKIIVAKNCWNQGFQSAIREGKLDYVIRIEIPIQELYCYKDGKRFVYLYSGQLVLRHYRHEFIKCTWEKDNTDVIALGIVTGVVGTLALLGIAAVKAIS